MPIKIKTCSTFCGYTDDGIIAFDDEVSKARREYIREHYQKWQMPFTSIYETQPQKTEYQMKILINELAQKHEIERVGDTTIYRGQTLVDRPNSLEKLKKIGVKTVVDLVGYGDFYKEKVKNAGLDYYEYNIYSNWWDRLDFDTPEYINKLTDFLSEMQKGNIYIGCQHVANDTDIALILNNFFNPVLEDKAKTKIPPNDLNFPVVLNTIYETLRPEHKKQLGWTKDFEQRLLKKLTAL